MGNEPARPTAIQRRELELKREELFARAACAISRADALVVFTGAGFSADSGLPVYNDVADVPAYHARGLEYSDLCTPGFQTEEPELFAGFWGGCFNDYRDTRPHDGYAVISGWRARLADSPLPAPFFSFTSNVDHHWATVLPPELLYECHGHMELWQCSSFACAEDLMGAGPDGAVDAGRWAAPPGYRVDVRAETRVAPADAPPAAAATHAVGSLQPHDAGAFARNHPACIRCGGAARPSVLFFDDDQWVPNKDAQGRWAAFSGALLAAARGRAEEDAPPLRVALLEIGAGGRVTTVRRSAEGLLCELERSGGATPVLIRVNPDLPLADRAAAKPYVLPILGKGLAAVRGIDAALRAAAGDAFLEPLEGLVLNSVYMGRPTGASDGVGRGVEECGAAAEGGGGVEESPP